jgi:hypothetical protein
VQLRRVARYVILGAVLTASASACGSSRTKPAPVEKAATALAAPTAPPAWETPAGWRTETIPFPLDFAKGLPYRGVEELRFPKPFLTPGDDWYFSYAFIWYVAAPGPTDAAALEKDLVDYFRGLAVAVGGADHADIAAHPFAAELDGDLAKGRVTGTVAAFDPFATKKPVTLQLRIWAVPCTASHERAYVFIASPRATADGDAVWAELERLGAAFRCP